MVRRLAALLSLLIIVALAVTLVLRVYEHHVRNGTFDDQPSLVRLSVDSDFPEKFAHAFCANL